MAKKLRIKEFTKDEIELKKLVNLVIDEHKCNIIQEPEKPEEPKEPEPKEPEPEEPEPKEPEPEPEEPEEPEPEEPKEPEPEEPEKGETMYDYPLEMVKNVPAPLKGAYIFNFIEKECPPKDYLNLIIIAHAYKNSNGRIVNVWEMARNIYHKFPIFKEYEIRKAVQDLKDRFPPSSLSESPAVKN